MAQGRGPKRRGGHSRGGPRGGTRESGSRDIAALELHPTAEPPDISSFREWALDPAVLDVIEGMGIEVPTPIQRLSIQPILDGRDVIAKAETGTGKTLAFGAPLVTKVDPARSSVLGLVLCPTRELAQQVAGVLETLGAVRGLRVALVVGGDPMHPQIKALQAGAQIVVGTPGRVMDLYGQGFLQFPWTEFAILDEADEMLEIGFLDDVKKIFGFLPDERQTLLFSATFPPELLKLAREHTREPVEVATALGVASVETIAHEWFRSEQDDMAIALTRLIEQSDEDDVLLVFCQRRTDVDRLLRRLERMPFSIKALHGGYDQASRFRVMSAFREKTVKALIATDVASRGLDVAHVSHVVNFGVPHDITEYTHRAGRTGRAGRSGHAVTIVPPSEMRKWNPLLARMTWPIEEVPMPDRSRSGGGRRGEGRDEPRSAGGGERGRGRDRGGRGEGRGGERSRGGRDARRDERPREPRRDESAAPAPPASSSSIDGAEPFRSDRAPREADRAPREADHAPREADRAPREADHAPREADRASREADHAPREAREGGEARDSREPRGERGRRRGGRGRGPRRDEGGVPDARGEREPRAEAAPGEERADRAPIARSADSARDDRGPRRERTERPRGRGPGGGREEGAGREERGERGPRRERGAERSSERRDERTAPQESRAERPAPGGFGTGLDEPRAETPRREKKPEPEPRKERREPDRSPPDRPSSGGFGAGL